MIKRYRSLFIILLNLSTHNTKACKNVEHRHHINHRLGSIVTLMGRSFITRSLSFSNLKIQFLVYSRLSILFPFLSCIFALVHHCGICLNLKLTDNLYRSGGVLHAKECMLVPPVPKRYVARPLRHVLLNEHVFVLS